MLDEYFIMSPVIQTLVYRLRQALSTLPTADAWLFSGVLLLILAMVSLPIGFYLGFLKIEILNASWDTTLGIIAGSFVRPAITEELFFRVLLLPQRDENPSAATLWLWGCISLAMFIVYHPLNALSFFPAGIKTFFDPVFLLLAALLGSVCTIAYLQSGSLWVSVVIHWLVVAVWLLLLGGYGRLNTDIKH